MTKRSNGSDQSASKTPEMIGYASSVPVKTTVSFKGPNGGRGAERSYENTSRVSYGDKQSGSYGRATATEKASAREFEWKNGTTGTRSEYTQSSTVRAGDRRGYTEVYREERVRNVTYDRSGCSAKNYITYGNEGGGSYGGYGSKNDVDDSGPYDIDGYGNDSDGGGSYGGYGNDSDDGGPYGGHGNDSDEGGPYGGHGNDSDDGGPYGGYGNESDDGGSYGGYGYNSDDGGSYEGYGDDSDY